MSTISSISYTALRGVWASQAAINVAGSNIANANSSDYSRQTITLKSGAGITLTSSVVFTGVDATEAARVYDRFLADQVNSASVESGNYDAQQKYLETIEVLFNESTDAGLNSALSDFWNAWQDLVNNPSGTSERANLVAVSENLADTFTNLGSGLEEIQQTIPTDIDDTTTDINRITGELATINAQLEEAANSGQNANELEDNRDSLLTELSELIDVKTTYLDNGQAYVYLSSGQVLVQGDSSGELSCQFDAAADQAAILLDDGHGGSTDVTVDISSGQLGGQLEVLNTCLPEYTEQLDNIASALIDSVNSLHTSGYDAEGNAGQVFFTGTGAADLAVNQNLVDDSQLIAAADSTDSAPGDGSIAAAIAELQNTNNLGPLTETIGDSLSSLVSEIGTRLETTESQEEYYANLLQLHETYQESYSGVSVDEETLKLTQYQNVYEACMKVIGIVQELMETIIEL